MSRTIPRPLGSSVEQQVVRSSQWRRHLAATQSSATAGWPSGGIDSVGRCFAARTYCQQEHPGEHAGGQHWRVCLSSPVVTGSNTHRSPSTAQVSQRVRLECRTADPPVVPRRLGQRPEPRRWWRPTALSGRSRHQPKPFAKGGLSPGENLIDHLER
jgi:hypothetical protein